METQTLQAVRLLCQHMSLQSRPLARLADSSVLVVPSRARHTAKYARAVRKLAQQLRPKRILVVGGQASQIAPILEEELESGTDSEVSKQVLTLPKDTPGTTATNVVDVARLCRLHGLTTDKFVVTQSSTAMRRVLRTFQTMWARCALSADVPYESTRFDSAPVDIFQPSPETSAGDNEPLFLHELCEEVRFLASFSEIGMLVLEDGDLNCQVMDAAKELEAYLKSQSKV